jgi:hypothetical protein
MLQFFSRSDSEAVEYNPSFENGCLLRYTWILSSNLHYVLLSGLASWHFLVNILYALLFPLPCIFPFSCHSLLVTWHTTEPNI